MSDQYKALLEQAIGNKFQKLLAPQQNQGGLLNFVKSPYASDIGMGLLAQSGYSTMPTSLGQSLGVAMNQANQLRSQRRANDIAELGTLTQLSEFFKEPDRKIIEDALGRKRYADSGGLVFPDLEMPEPERKTADDVNGVLRFIDTGDPVFPNVKGEFTASTVKDKNDRLRYLDGPQKGELVFPNLVVEEKFEKPSPITLQNLKDPTDQITLDLNNRDQVKKYYELTNKGFVIRQENLTSADIQKAKQSANNNVIPKDNSNITENQSSWDQFTEQVITDTEYDDAIKIAQAGNKGIQAGEELRKLILADPNIAGTMGSLQQLAKSTGGTFESIGLNMPFFDKFQKESISQLANLENQLAYSLATVRGYKSGSYEVKAKDIERAKEELNITGMLGGPKGVLDRVNAAIEEIAGSTNDAQTRAGIEVADYSQFIYTGD